MTTDRKLLFLVLCGLAGVIAGLAATAFAERAERLKLEKTVAVLAKRVGDAPGLPRMLARAEWPPLAPDKVVAIGEALAGSPTSVAIFCGNPDCNALAHDLDDAFQIADWPSDVERAAFGAEETGIIVGPPSPAADSVARALVRAGLPARIDQVNARAAVGVVIGRRR